MDRDADPAPAAAGDACAQCGADLRGPYCHRCGERAIDPARESVGAYFAQAVGALLSMDGRWPRAVRRLLFEPGGQARDWLAGRRRDTPGPWALFIAANVVYYFATSFLNAGLMRGTLKTQTSPPSFWAGWAESKVNERVATEGIELWQIAERYDDHGEGVSKLLIITLIPMFAALLWLGHFRRERRPLAHLVLATHFVAYWALVPSLGLPYLAETLLAQIDSRVAADLSWLRGDPIVVSVILTSGAAWLYGAERRLYGIRSRSTALLRGVLLIFAFLVIIMLPFRFTEFLVTWATL